jgi:hypothetical protein
MFATIDRRRAGRATLGAVGMVLVLATTVFAESGFSAVTTLRTGPSGAGVEVQDIAATGRAVSVVWQELSGGNGVLRVRTSTDGGQTFRAARLVEDRHGGYASTDVCGDHAWVAHSFRLPGDSEGTDGLIIDGFPLSVPGGSGELIVPSGGSQWVDGTDFACVGSRRRAVAWVDRDLSGTTRVRVRFLGLHADVKGGAPPEFDQSFVAGTYTSVALAATATRAWLAWQTADGLVRIKPYTIGSGPDYPVTPGAAVTLPDTGTPTGRIVLGASGSRVVIGYGMNAHTFARVSTDSGMSFGPRRRLLEGILGGDYETTAVSADIRGARAVVHAAGLGGFKDYDVEAYRFTSTNVGASWSGERRFSDGFRMGALSVLGGDTRLVEAWDQVASTATQKWIRFHREL